MNSANRLLSATVEEESDHSCTTRTVKNPFGCTAGLTSLIENHIKPHFKIVHQIQIRLLTRQITQVLS